MTSSSKTLVLGVCALAVAFFSGCTSTGASGPVTISKVNPYHLREQKLVRTDDEMIEFEQRRHLYGVVDSADFREKKGYYYTIFWNTKTKNPATVRFDYRLAATGPEIHTKEVVISSPKHRNATKFEVIGEEHLRNGNVTQWKASIVENGAVVAEYKSFLWK